MKLYSVFTKKYQEEDFGGITDAPHEFIGTFNKQTAKDKVAELNLNIKTFKAQFGENTEESYVVKHRLNDVITYK